MILTSMFLKKLTNLRVDNRSSAKDASNWSQDRSLTLLGKDNLHYYVHDGWVTS